MTSVPRKERLVQRARWRLFIVVLLFSISFSGTVSADNPVIKDRYTADPAALVHDGKIYLYTGHDEATPADSFFVLKEWSIFASDDLATWTHEGDLPRTAFSWAHDDTAWASQAIERDGTFYWYTTVKNKDARTKGFAIGVATSDHPTRGFTDALGQPLIDATMTEAPASMGNDPWDMIDPTVFIDDDGDAYLYFGNTHLYMVKLKDNMIERDGDIERVEIKAMPGSFTEGPFIFKRNNLYYLTFAYNYPEELAYATSESVTGPWVFQDKIMDRLPNSGTSHPAVISFENQWYIIYHTASLPGGGEHNRSVAFEPLHFYADGAIAKITPTASGVTDESLTITSSLNALSLRQVTHQLTLEALDTTNHDFRFHETEALRPSGNDYVSYQIDNHPGVYLIFDEENTLRLRRNTDNDATFNLRASFLKAPAATNDQAFTLQPAFDESYFLRATERLLDFTHTPQAEADEAIHFIIEEQDTIVPRQQQPLKMKHSLQATDNGTRTKTENQPTSDKNSALDDSAPVTVDRWWYLFLGAIVFLILIRFVAKKKKQ